jgi:hypothetical protein
MSFKAIGREKFKKPLLFKDLSVAPHPYQGQWHKSITEPSRREAE